MERLVTSELFRELSLQQRQELRELGLMEGYCLYYDSERGFRYGGTMDNYHGLPKRVGDSEIKAVTTVVWFRPSKNLGEALLRKFAM